MVRCNCHLSLVLLQNLVFVRPLNVRTCFDARTRQLVISHCILAAAAPLSKDDLIQGKGFWEPMQSLHREVTVLAA